MSDLKMVPIKEPEHIAELVNLAEAIWREYFPSILTQDKLDHLLKHMLSIEVLTREIADEGYEFYFAQADDKNIGFIGIVQQDDALFLSKLYLLKEARDKGYGRQEFNFVLQRAKELGLKKITLTCDRNNSASWERYEHMGFVKTGEVDTDVGGGYQMNDYTMEYIIQD